MGTEQQSEYYDQNMSSHLIPFENSHWRPVYEKAVTMLPSPSEKKTIIDVGCGTGRFAKLLYDKGYRHYLGIDFSKGMLAEAKRYVPQFNFIEGNVYDQKIRDLVQKYDTFVFLEILEHIEKDIEFLSILPRNSHIVISLPNFDCASHVRSFRSISEITNRYNSILDFKDGQQAAITHKGIFVLSCKRK